jgi:hypothetical protein
MFLGVEGLLFLAVLAFWIWAVIDSISTESARCRNLPKVAWVIIVVLFGIIGALAWLFFGRPERSSWRPGSTDYSAPRRPIGIEDSPHYLEVSGDISDRRSEELDRQLDEWERKQQAERPALPPVSDPSSTPSERADLDAWEAELAAREDDVRRRELELRERELEERDRGLDDS